MKFKRYNNFKKIIKRHYEVLIDYHTNRINELENYCNSLNSDISTLLMIIDHYEQILMDSGVEFESLSYIFRKPEDL